MKKTKMNLKNSFVFIVIIIFLFLANCKVVKKDAIKSNLAIRIELGMSNKYNESNQLLNVDVLFYTTDTNTYILSKRIIWDTKNYSDVLFFELFFENRDGNFEKITPSDNIDILTTKGIGYWKINSNLIVKQTYPISSIYKIKKGNYLIRGIFNTKDIQLTSNYLLFTIQE